VARARNRESIVILNIASFDIAGASIHGLIGANVVGAISIASAAIRYDKRLGAQIS
jgi:hypothetical protein